MAIVALWGLHRGRAKARHFPAASKYVEGPAEDGSREAAVRLLWGRGVSGAGVDEEGGSGGVSQAGHQLEACGLVTSYSQVTSPPARPQLPVAAGRSLGSKDGRRAQGPTQGGQRV